MARDHLRTTGESWDKPLLQAQQQRFLQRMRRSALELSGHGGARGEQGDNITLLVPAANRRCTYRVHRSMPPQPSSRIFSYRK